MDKSAPARNNHPDWQAWGPKLSHVHQQIAKETSTIINTVEGSEDLTWTNNGVILMSDGNSLFSFHPGYEKDWKFVIDFKEFDLTNISRISLDRGNNYIAIVAEAIKN